MNKNQFAKAVMTVAAGFVFLCAAQGLARAENALPVAMQTPNAPRPGAQAKKDAAPPNDFAGLNFTDEQKAELDKIHRESESHKQAVVSDQKLTEDQKNAMLLGYTRIEYGEDFKVLTPQQQKQVRQRVLARRAADKAALKKQPPRN